MGGAGMAVTVDPGLYLSTLSQSVEGHLGALRVALRSLEDGSFQSKAAKPRPGAFLKLSLELPAAPDAAIAQLCNRCFVSVVGELVTYLDRMIAVKRFTSKQVPIPSGTTTTDGVLRLVQRLLDEEYAAVARDTSLSNPKKLADFPGIAAIARDSSLSYFAVRRCLEHHSGLPAEDITLWYGRMKLLAGDMEITEAGQAAPPGVGISLALEHVLRVLPVGAAVVLNEDELERVVFTVQTLIGPEIRRVLVEAPATHPPREETH
jgi:hypothetical protein